MNAAKKLQARACSKTVAEAVRARALSVGAEWSPDWAIAVERFARMFEERLDVPLDELTIGQVEALRASFGANRHYANKALGIVRSVWQWAQQRGYVSAQLRSPAEAVPMFAVSAPCWAADSGLLGTILEATQIGMTLADERRRLSPYMVSARDGQAIILLGHTARRPSEILCRSAEDYAPRSRALHLGKTKNGEQQQIPLEGPALEAVRAAVERVGGRGLLFASDTGTPMTSVGLRKPWGRVLEIAEQRLGAVGIAKRSDGKNLALRDLRALGVTAMLRARVEVPVICKVTGHSGQMVARYARLNLDDAREAVKAMHKEAIQGGTKKPKSAELIRARMRELDITQAELGRLMGAKRQSVSVWARDGIEGLPVARCRELAALLKTDLSGIGVS